jgi:iron complex outermembrane recepter protein
MKKIYFTLLLAALQKIAFSQFSIQGSVTPVKQATLFIGSLNLKTITDSSGHFVLRHIPSGNYLIEISSLGYQSQVISCEVTTSSSPIMQLDPIEMHEEHFLINEIIVSGTQPALQKNTSLVTEVVKVAEMFERGQTSIMEALASKPGISIVTTGPGIARPVIRGLTTNRIATIMNGVKLENQQWDIEHTLGLNQYGIDRVEIIKGPASFLYGSDAMGGILNFIDESPAPLNRMVGEVSAGFNSNTFGSTSSLNLRGAQTHLNWGLTAGLNNSSDYYNADFERIANSRYREFLGKATLGLNSKKSTTLFSYQLNTGYYGIVEPFESDSAGVEEEDHPMEFEEPYHKLTHQTALVKNTLLLGRNKLTSNLSYQNDLRKELEPGDSETDPFLGFNLNIVSLDVKLNHAFTENNNFIVGMQGSYQSNQNKGYSILIPDYQQQDFSAYAVNTYSLIKQNLKIDIGLRYDQRNIESETSGIKDSVDFLPTITKKYSNLSSSLGLNFSVSKNSTLYLNVGTGYRAPNMAELTSNGIRLESQVYELGKSSFSKETNVQTDIGLIVSGKQMGIELSGFYNKLNDFIYTKRRGDSIQHYAVYEFNQSDAWIYGGEAKIGVYPKGYKWLNITSSLALLQGHLAGGGFLPMMPPYKINNEITIQHHLTPRLHKGYIRLGIISSAAQNRVAVNELKTPAYTLLNLNFGGEIIVMKQTIIIALGLNNLLNQHYYDHLSRLRQYNVNNMGINAFINIKIPISIVQNQS